MKLVILSVTLATHNVDIAFPAPAPSLRGQVARTALSRLRDKSFFDCQPIEDAAEVMGRKLDTESKTYLRAMHCSYYKAMSPDVVAWLSDLVSWILAEEIS